MHNSQTLRPILLLSLHDMHVVSFGVFSQLVRPRFVLSINRWHPTTADDVESAAIQSLLRRHADIQAWVLAQKS